MRPLIAPLLFTGLLLYAFPAQAQNCSGRSAWFLLRFQGGGGVDAHEDMTADLAVELRGMKLAVCTKRNRPATQAEGQIVVNIPRLRTQDTRIAVELIDGTQQVRRLDLGEVPYDGWSLSVAVTSAELVRALYRRPKRKTAPKNPTLDLPVYVELKPNEGVQPETKPEPPPPPPPEAPPPPEPEPKREIVDTPVAPKPDKATTAPKVETQPAEDEPSRWRVYGRLALAHYFETPHFGGEAALSARLLEALSVEIALGGDQSLTQTLTQGSLTVRQFGVAASALYTPLRADLWSLSAEAGPRVAWVQLRPTAAEGFLAENQSLASLYLRGGLRLQVLTGSKLGFEIRTGVGAPLLGARATADSAAVGGSTGLEIYGSLGLSLGL